MKKLENLYPTLSETIKTAMCGGLWLECGMEVDKPNVRREREGYVKYLTKLWLKFCITNTFYVSAYLNL